ncbi:hypothetical protein B0T14DRAFT_562591 [Immersiella caudata]|uniref:Uncharacterized protein n=1 Tax=Immersiella caudata TaxID=314043 RepID=A0AA40C6R0_9PEZI|nr:hypothetical protein B0T14DRAFT_562591 [Immersiella caudata]
MAAKFENASKDTGYIPSPMRSVFKPNSVLSRYTVNPSPSKKEREGTIALSPGRSEQQSDPHNSVDMGDENVSRGELMSTDDGRDDNSIEGQWIHRNVAPSKSEDSLSQPSVSKSSGETPDKPARHLGETPLKPAMKAVPEPTGGLSGRSQESERKKANARVVSFSNTTESRSASRTTLNSELSGQVVPPDVLETPEDPSQMSDASAAASGVDDAPVSPRSKNLTLHAQIRSLRRQVAAKTTEVQQLQRMLDASQNADVAILREHLRLTERECVMWRERAEAAEKKVESFKRLSARLKKLRETEAGRERGLDSEQLVAGVDEPITGDGTLDGGNERHGDSRMMELWLDGRQRESSTEHTEDEATVTERIRRSLQAMDNGLDVKKMASDPFQDKPRAANQLTGSKGDNGVGHSAFRVGIVPGAPQLTYQPSYRSSTSEDGGRLSDTVASIWIAAEKVLESEQSQIRRTRSKRNG